MATNAAAGKCLGAHAALASRASISRRARLAPSRVPARQTRGRAATRAGPEDQLGTGNGDDLNYNVLAERMKALQAKESADTNEAVDAAIEREQAIVAGIRGDAADRPMRESPGPSRDSSRSPRSTFSPPPFFPKTTTGQHDHPPPSLADRPTASPPARPTHAQPRTSTPSSSTSSPPRWRPWTTRPSAAARS